MVVPLSLPLVRTPRPNCFEFLPAENVTVMSKDFPDTGRLITSVDVECHRFEYKRGPRFKFCRLEWGVEISRDPPSIFSSVSLRGTVIALRHGDVGMSEA